MVRVRPARSIRTDFARYVAHRDGRARMLTEADFAVPEAVYVHMPERLLIGAVVEGHPYVPVTDEPEVAVPEPESEAPAPAPVDDPANADYGEAHGNLDAPADEVPETFKDAPDASTKQGFACPICNKPMLNAKGVETHLARRHADETAEES